MSVQFIKDISIHSIKDFDESRTPPQITHHKALLKAKTSELNTQIYYREEAENKLQLLKSDLIKKDELIISLKRKISEITTNLEETESALVISNQSISEMEVLQNKNQRLNDKVQSLQEELDVEKLRNVELTEEVKSLKQQLAVAKEEAKIKMDHNQKDDSVEKATSNEVSLYSNMSSYEVDLFQKMRDLLLTRNSAQEEIKQKDKRICELECELLELTRTNVINEKQIRELQHESFKSQRSLENEMNIDAQKKTISQLESQIQILTQDSDYLKKDYDLRIKTLELEKMSIEMKFEYQRNHDFETITKLTNQVSCICEQFQNIQSQHKEWHEYIHKLDQDNLALSNKLEDYKEMEELLVEKSKHLDFIGLQLGHVQTNCNFTVPKFSNPVISSNNSPQSNQEHQQLSSDKKQTDDDKMSLMEALNELQKLTPPHVKEPIGRSWIRKCLKKKGKN